MINITFDPKNLDLKMEGHAGADEKGRDLVCASASMLFYTLAQSLANSVDMLKKHPIIEWEDGKGHIKCRPKKEYEGNISVIYWTILNGFELLDDEFSNFISLKVVG